MIRNKFPFISALKIEPGMANLLRRGLGHKLKTTLLMLNEGCGCEVAEWGNSGTGFYARVGAVAKAETTGESSLTSCKCCRVTGNPSYPPALWVSRKQ